MRPATLGFIVLLAKKSALLQVNTQLRPRLSRLIMTIKTHIKAGPGNGGILFNHNQTQTTERTRGCTFEPNQSVLTRTSILK